MSAHRHTHFGPDTGMVEYFSEDHAQAAEEALHCADVDGTNIAVQIYQSRRTVSGATEFNTNAPSFVPSGSVASYPAQYSPGSPTRSNPYRSPRQSVSSIVHGPGQQVQIAPPGSSHSGLIDPCNLFCKNLDPEIDSNALFSHFRHFGQIVSARVMRTDSGESRGFGFVSYQSPDQASAALHAMNGALLGSKQIVVRLHEPKNLRQEKLAQRFGSPGHPRNTSGATSPTVSEGGESFGGWHSPRASYAQLGSPTHDRHDRGRRGSGSYYNAAVAGTLNVSLRFDDLVGLSPVVRKEILAGEFNRRVRALETVPVDEVDSVVDQLSNLTLGHIVDSLENTDKLRVQVQLIQSKPKASPPQEASRSPSADASQRSSLQDSTYLNATASAPEHPSTPISVSTSSTPPRTSSPSGSVPPASERDRMMVAISRLESSKQEELTELLMSLPKRERALCLFNAEILRSKLADAKAVLESDDEEPAPPVAAPVTPKNKTSARVAEESPRTPDLSSQGASAAASPVPSTPGSQVHTAATLAKLSAAEVVKIAGSAPASSLGFPKADALVVKATDEFVDSLSGFSVQLQKQKLGDKLFKVIKAFGIKGAPKITIALLDEEELRPLAHLMNSYPSVLKEKALQVQANSGGK